MLCDPHHPSPSSPLPVEGEGSPESADAFPQMTTTVTHRTIAPMKNRLAIAMVIAAAVIGLSVAALVAFFIMRKSAQPKVTSTATVVLQIQSLSELVTVKYVLEKIVPVEAAKTDTIDNLPGISSLRSDKII